MKSKRRKRVIASVLCMVLMLSTGISTLAEADAGAVPAVEETTAAQTTTQETESTSTETKTVETEAQAQAETETQTETKQTEEAVQTQPEETTAAQPTEEASGGETTQTETDQTAQNTQDQTTSAETSGTETQNETVETQPEETETTMQTEVTQETKEEASVSPAFNETYENSEVTVKVTADEGIVPEGAELSVTPIVKKEITDQMSEEEKAEAKKINDQYDLTEKKLSEDSDKNKEIMEGFLAYDISFLVDGKEVEPSGDVKVVIDFKKAAVPEGVSEDAAVAVKHLKEDPIAEDGVVVEDMDEKADVQVTDKAEVEKVEFTSDSFSTYTIYWNNSRTLEVQVVDTNGRGIGSNGNVTLSENAATVEEIASQITAPSGYEFKEARTGGNNLGESKTKVKELRYGSSSNQYRESGERDWEKVRKTIYFVYSKLPGTLQTADTSDYIQLNLFDYTLDSDSNGMYKEQNDNDNNYKGDATGINEGHDFKFQSYGGARPAGSINASGGNSTNSGIVRSKLVNGFPALNPKRSDGESLAYLFNTTPIEGVKSVHEGLTNLFSYDPNTGSYSYDSGSNYAYLDLESNPNNKSFTVYDTTARDGDDQNAQFFPFTKYSVANGASRGPKTEVGLDCNSEQNHYFGMTMSTTFIQPQGGMINGQDMIFSFSGDDDVWVYIDGVLVLDIGGSHSAITGTINFNTGVVTVNGKREYLANILREGGVSEDKLSGHTLRNYRDFQLDFFYLERGNYDSNCKLEFNLASIPDQSVMVTKEVTDQNGEAIDYTSNIEFLFEISYDDNVYANREYQIWKNGRYTGKTGTTNDDGEFTLRNGESAVFQELNVQSKYQVVEKGAYLNGYEVTIEGTNITDQEGDEISSGPQYVGETPVLVFHNQVDDTATLTVKKELASGSKSNEQFTIRLSIDNIAYNGNYQLFKDGEYIQAGNTRNGIIELEAGQSIQISGLPYGVNFEIYEILNGSYLPEYSVGGNVYNVLLPDENGNGIDENRKPVYDQNGEQIIGVTTATGNLNGNAQVVITNEIINVDNGSTSLTVTKGWEAGTEEIRPNSINVTLYQDNNNNGIKDTGDTIVSIPSITPTIQLNEENEWTYTWSNLPADTNFVVEESESQQGDLEDFEASYQLASEFKFVENGRLTSCKNTEYNIGQNNMLLIKLTGNEGYVLWTPVNLGLDANEVQEIAQELQTMDLSGSGNLNLDNLFYIYGNTNDYMTGVTLEKLEEGWHLEFAQTSAWAQFWNFQYDRTIQADIVNTLKDKKISIPVTKIWKGDTSQYSFDFVTVQLYQNGEAYGQAVQITESAGWKYTYTDLPYWDKDHDGYKAYEYTVEETFVGTFPIENCEDWLFTEISGSAEDGFTITNNVPKLWGIGKVSSTNHKLPLEGAEFTLTSQDTSKVRYYGLSGNDGLIRWWTSYSDLGNIEKVLKFVPDGTYILEETKAPVGYQKNNVTWTIEIDDLQVTSIIDSKGIKIKPITPENRATSSIDIYLYENIPLYELPSAGGPGIFGYTIGGVLLLMAGTLILYKLKDREVLKK